MDVLLSDVGASMTCIREFRVILNHVQFQRVSLTSTGQVSDSEPESHNPYNELIVRLGQRNCTLPTRDFEFRDRSTWNIPFACRPVLLFSLCLTVSVPNGATHPHSRQLEHSATSSTWLIELHHGEDNRLTPTLINDALQPALDVVERDWSAGREAAQARKEKELDGARGALIIVGKRNQDKFFSNGA